MRYGLVIDLKRCVGCNACTIACKQKNSTPAGIYYGRVLIRETGKYPLVHQEFQPILCMHCSEAPCVEVCPTGATQKLDNGIVIVDQEKCIGCRYCMTACPYNARSFNYSRAQSFFPQKEATLYEQTRQGEHILGTVEKCDFCVDRVEAGELPACVETCPASARVFGDLDDPQSEVSQLIAQRGGRQLRPEIGTDPSVYYLDA
jgi:Fe-S-cluster-containing dehydrogenase component